jgi:hypothetical protein
MQAPAAVAKPGQTHEPQKLAPFGACGFESHRPHSMRPPEQVDRVRALAVGGLNHCQIARATGIPRSTVRAWVLGRTRPRVGGCERCGHLPHDFSRLPAQAYAYLFGIYLGDGTITRFPRGVWALQIFQDSRYPAIIDEIAAAMRTVMPANTVRVAKHPRHNYVQIASYSKAWPCYFPQCGPGLKHRRKIELRAWQWAYVWQEPGSFLRGLIHSDGCRVSNKVWGGRYEYPRYFFSNESTDIQQLFRDACDLIGIEHRNNRRNSISVARRASVALLDEIVGPKT